MTDPDTAWRHTNIGRIMNNALSRFEQRVIDLMASAGYTQSRYSHLNLTRNLDLAGTRTTELARRACMTKQAMAEIVEQCEKLGLVSRRADTTDARAKIVVFTEKGEAWLRCFRQSLATAENEMREELGYLRVDAIANALAEYGKGYDSLREDG